MTIVFVAVAQVVAVALCALAVRAQMDLFRGFDVMIAAGVTIASELTCGLGILFPDLGWSGPVTAVLISSVVISILIVGWNHLVRLGIRDSDRKGTALLVGSLFCSTAVSGFVGVARGPGLQAAPWSFVGLRLADGSSLGLGTCFGCTMGLFLLAGVIAWRRSQAGLSLELWSQDRSFACEIGISERALVGPTGVAVGLTAAAVGVWSALSNGSTPDVGLSFFLSGAGGALLFAGPRLGSAAIGGALIGLVAFCMQLLVSPSMANMILFFGIAVFLVTRGSRRAKQRVR
jgi:branched-subunit amino acid ABC-type transport system permease component